MKDEVNTYKKKVTEQEKEVDMYKKKTEEQEKKLVGIEKTQKLKQFEKKSFFITNVEFLKFCKHNFMPLTNIFQISEHFFELSEP